MATRARAASDGDSWGDIEEVVGVYHADGGLVGELRYVWGRVVRRDHCSLCDITHAGVRRRRSFDEIAERWPVPIRLLHRDEQPPAVAEVVAGTTPCVVAIRPSDRGGPVVVLGPADLDRVAGDVVGFDEALRTAIESLLQERRK